MKGHILQRSFKGHRRYLEDENVVNSLELPECLGQNVILLYLNLADTWCLRSVSKQFRSWATNAIKCRNDLRLEKHELLTFESFETLVANAKTPRSLAIVECKRLDIPSVTPSVKPKLTSLEQLTIRNCEKLTNNSLVQILIHCAGLTAVDTDLLSAPAVVVLCKSATKLRHLCADDSGSHFQDKALEVLAKAPCIETLESLSMASCGVSNQGVQYLLSRLKRPLCLLDVSGCTGLTCSGTANALKGSNGMVEKVVLRRIECTDAMLSYASSTAAVNLKELVLGYCGSLGNRVVADFGLSLAAKGLTVLELNGACHVNVDAFCRMLSHARNLQELKLTNCRQINDDFLFQLSYSCPNLTTLGVKSCDQISDAGLRSLVQGCRQLEVLDLSCCFGLSDEGVHAIASKCVKLRELLLFCCYSISDAGIMDLARWCRGLEMLDVSWCYKITSTSLSALVKRCSCLGSLRIEGCRQISEFEAQNLVHMSHRMSQTDLIRSKGNALSTEKNPGMLRRAESDSSMKPRSGQRSKKQFQRHRSAIQQVSLVHSSSKPKPGVSFGNESFILSSSVPTPTTMFPRRRRQSMESQENASASQLSLREHYVSLDQLEKKEKSRRKSLSGRRLWGEEDEDVERFNAFSTVDSVPGKLNENLEELRLGINPSDAIIGNSSPTSPLSASSTDAESVFFDMEDVALSATKRPG